MSDAGPLRVGRERLRTAMADTLEPVASGYSPGVIVTKGREVDVVVTSAETFLENRSHATEGVIARKLWELKDRNQHPSGPAMVKASELTGLTGTTDMDLAFYADAWTEANCRVKRVRTQHLREFLAEPKWQFDLSWIMFPGRWVYSVVEAGIDAPGFIVVGCGSEVDYLSPTVIAAVMDLPESVKAAWAMGPAANMT